MNQEENKRVSYSKSYSCDTIDVIDIDGMRYITFEDNIYDLDKYSEEMKKFICEIMGGNIPLLKEIDNNFSSFSFSSRDGLISASPFCNSFFAPQRSFLRFLWLMDSGNGGIFFTINAS